MKRMFTLLLAAMLPVLALTGCGNDRGENQNNGGSSVANGSGSTSGAASGSDRNDIIAGTDENPSGKEDGLLNGNGSTSQNPMADDGNSAATTPADNGSAGSASGSRSSNSLVRGAEDVVEGTGRAIEDTGRMIRGATYEQMLRNGYVHDTDGYLFDNENAVTPGTVYY